MAHASPNRCRKRHLVALLAPEHGIRGDAMDGVTIQHDTDAKTGVPVYSLYLSEDRGPTDAMLANVDVLVYDRQEVGGRTWTYVSTMALSMQAAKRKGIPFVVLDRPNPIGGEIVEGALLDSETVDEFVSRLRALSVGADGPTCFPLYRLTGLQRIQRRRKCDTGRSAARVFRPRGYRRAFRSCFPNPTARGGSSN